MNPLIVVGIGLDGPAGLAPEARTALAEAEVLAGGKRLLTLFPAFAGAKIALDGDMAGWIETLQARDRNKKTVLLASGDPLFFGIGRLLLAAFSKEELLFLPHVNSIALAFARLKETWNDACVVSLHGRPLQTILPALERREPKIAVFTDADNNPAAIARLLDENGLADFYAQWVCENVGGAHERIARWHPCDMTQQSFAPLNVVVLLRVPGASASPSAQRLPLIGLPEAAFRHRGEPHGMITKWPTRLHALGLLELHPGDVLWDIGAGSGSVALEAARLAPTLSAYAVEKADDALGFLRENVANLGVGNVHVIAGEAPARLADLPDPDAIFIGGSGGKLRELLESAVRRLKPKGRLVLSCIALETFSQAWNWLAERGLDPQATSLQLAQSRPLGKLHRLEPEQPIFFLRVKKP